MAYVPKSLLFLIFFLSFLAKAEKKKKKKKKHPWKFKSFVTQQIRQSEKSHKTQLLLPWINIFQLKRLVESMVGN